MKKLFVALMCILMFTAFGCSLFSNKIIQNESQVGVVLVLKNNPQDIQGVLSGLTVISDYLKCGVCGVADLKTVIAKALPVKYAEVGDIIMAGVDDPELSSVVGSLMNHNLSADTVNKLGVNIDQLIGKIKAIQ